MSIHPERTTLREIDGLDAQRRDEVLEHVASCSRCRDVFVGEDPTRLFALLGRSPVPEKILDEVTANVMAGIAGGDVSSIGLTQGRGRGWIALAAAAVLAVALVLIPFGKTPDDEAAGVAAAPRATVTLIDSPGEAQLVDLAVGETQIVMIFDREMDL